MLQTVQVAILQIRVAVVIALRCFTTMFMGKILARRVTDRSTLPSLDRVHLLLNPATTSRAQLVVIRKLS